MRKRSARGRRWNGASALVELSRRANSSYKQRHRIPPRTRNANTLTRHQAGPTRRRTTAEDAQRRNQHRPNEPSPHHGRLREMDPKSSRDQLITTPALHGPQDRLRPSIWARLAIAPRRRHHPHPQRQAHHARLRARHHVRPRAP